MSRSIEQKFDDDEDSHFRPNNKVLTLSQQALQLNISNHPPSTHKSIINETNDVNFMFNNNFIKNDLPQSQQQHHQQQFTSIVDINNDIILPQHTIHTNTSDNIHTNTATSTLFGTLSSNINSTFPVSTTTAPNITTPVLSHIPSTTFLTPLSPGTYYQLYNYIKAYNLDAIIRFLDEFKGEYDLNTAFPSTLYHNPSAPMTTTTKTPSSTSSTSSTQTIQNEDLTAQIDGIPIIQTEITYATATPLLAAISLNPTNQNESLLQKQIIHCLLIFGANIYYIHSPSHYSLKYNPPLARYSPLIANSYGKIFSPLIELILQHKFTLLYHIITQYGLILPSLPLSTLLIDQSNTLKLEDDELFDHGGDHADQNVSIDSSSNISTNYMSSSTVLLPQSTAAYIHHSLFHLLIEQFIRLVIDHDLESTITMQCFATIQLWLSLTSTPQTNTLTLFPSTFSLNRATQNPPNYIDTNPLGRSYILEQPEYNHDVHMNNLFDEEFVFAPSLKQKVRSFLFQKLTDKISNITTTTPATATTTAVPVTKLTKENLSKKKAKTTAKKRTSSTKSSLVQVGSGVGSGMGGSGKSIHLVSRKTMMDMDDNEDFDDDDDGDNNKDGIDSINGNEQYRHNHREMVDISNRDDGNVQDNNESDDDQHEIKSRKHTIDYFQKLLQIDMNDFGHLPPLSQQKVTENPDGTNIYNLRQPPTSPPPKQQRGKNNDNDLDQLHDQDVHKTDTDGMNDNVSVTTKQTMKKSSRTGVKKQGELALDMMTSLANSDIEIPLELATPAQRHHQHSAKEHREFLRNFVDEHCGDLPIKERNQIQKILAKHEKAHVHNVYGDLLAAAISGMTVEELVALPTPVNGHLAAMKANINVEKMVQHNPSIHPDEENDSNIDDGRGDGGGSDRDGSGDDDDSTITSTTSTGSKKSTRTKTKSSSAETKLDPLEKKALREQEKAKKKEERLAKKALKELEKTQSSTPKRKYRKRKTHRKTVYTRKLDEHGNPVNKSQVYSDSDESYNVPIYKKEEALQRGTRQTRSRTGTLPSGNRVLSESGQYDEGYNQNDGSLDDENEHNDEQNDSSVVYEWPNDQNQFNNGKNGSNNIQFEEYIPQKRSRARIPGIVNNNNNKLSTQVGKKSNLGMKNKKNNQNIKKDNINNSNTSPSFNLDPFSRPIKLNSLENIDTFLSTRQSIRVVVLGLFNIDLSILALLQRPVFNTELHPFFFYTQHSICPDSREHEHVDICSYEFDMDQTNTTTTATKAVPSDNTNNDTNKFSPQSSSILPPATAIITNMLKQIALSNTPITPLYHFTAFAVQLAKNNFKGILHDTPVYSPHKMSQREHSHWLWSYLLSQHITPVPHLIEKQITLTYNNDSNDNSDNKLLQKSPYNTVLIETTPTMSRMNALKSVSKKIIAPIANIIQNQQYDFITLSFSDDKRYVLTKRDHFIAFTLYSNPFISIIEFDKMIRSCCDIPLTYNTTTFSPQEYYDSLMSISSPNCISKTPQDIDNNDDSSSSSTLSSSSSLTTISLKTIYTLFHPNAFPTSGSVFTEVIAMRRFDLLLYLLQTWGPFLVEIYHSPRGYLNIINSIVYSNYKNSPISTPLFDMVANIKSLSSLMEYLTNFYNTHYRDIIGQPLTHPFVHPQEIKQSDDKVDTDNSDNNHTHYGAKLDPKPITTNQPPLFIPNGILINQAALCRSYCAPKNIGNNTTTDTKATTTSSTTNNNNNQSHQRNQMMNNNNNTLGRTAHHTQQQPPAMTRIDSFTDYNGTNNNNNDNNQVGKNINQNTIGTIAETTFGLTDNPNTHHYSHTSSIQPLNQSIMLNKDLNRYANIVTDEIYADHTDTTYYGIDRNQLGLSDQQWEILQKQHKQHDEVILDHNSTSQQQQQQRPDLLNIINDHIVPLEYMILNAFIHHEITYRLCVILLNAILRARDNRFVSLSRTTRPSSATATTKTASSTTTSSSQGLLSPPPLQTHTSSYPYAGCSLFDVVNEVYEREQSLFNRNVPTRTGSAAASIQSNTSHVPSASMSTSLLSLHQSDMDKKSENQFENWQNLVFSPPNATVSLLSNELYNDDLSTPLVPLGSTTFDQLDKHFTSIGETKSSTNYNNDENNNNNKQKDSSNPLLLVGPNIVIQHMSDDTPATTTAATNKNDGIGHISNTTSTSTSSTGDNDGDDLRMINISDFDEFRTFKSPQPRQIVNNGDTNRHGDVDITDDEDDKKQPTTLRSVAPVSRIINTKSTPSILNQSPIIVPTLFGSKGPMASGHIINNHNNKNNKVDINKNIIIKHPTTVIDIQPPLQPVLPSTSTGITTIVSTMNDTIDDLDQDNQHIDIDIDTGEATTTTTTSNMDVLDSIMEGPHITAPAIVDQNGNENFSNTQASITSSTTTITAGGPSSIATNGIHKHAPGSISFPLDNAISDSETEQLISAKIAQQNPIPTQYQSPNYTDLDTTTTATAAIGTTDTMIPTTTAQLSMPSCISETKPVFIPPPQPIVSHHSMNDEYNINNHGNINMSTMGKQQQQQQQPSSRTTLASNITNNDVISSTKQMINNPTSLFSIADSPFQALHSGTSWSGGSLDNNINRSNDPYQLHIPENNNPDLTWAAHSLPQLDDEIVTILSNESNQLTSGQSGWNTMGIVNNIVGAGITTTNNTTNNNVTNKINTNNKSNKLNLAHVPSTNFISHPIQNALNILLFACCRSASYLTTLRSKMYTLYTQISTHMAKVAIYYALGDFFEYTNHPTHPFFSTRQYQDPTMPNTPVFITNEDNNDANSIQSGISSTNQAIVIDTAVKLFAKYQTGYCVIPINPDHTHSTQLSRDDSIHKEKHTTKSLDLNQHRYPEPIIINVPTHLFPIPSIFDTNIQKEINYDNYNIIKRKITFLFESTYNEILSINPHIIKDSQHQPLQQQQQQQQQPLSSSSSAILPGDNNNDPVHNNIDSTQSKTDHHFKPILCPYADNNTTSSNIQSHHHHIPPHHHIPHHHHLSQDKISAGGTSLNSMKSICTRYNQLANRLFANTAVNRCRFQLIQFMIMAGITSFLNRHNHNQSIDNDKIILRNDNDGDDSAQKKQRILDGVNVPYSFNVTNENNNDSINYNDDDDDGSENLFENNAPSINFITILEKLHNILGQDNFQDNANQTTNLHTDQYHKSLFSSSSLPSSLSSSATTSSATTSLQELDNIVKQYISGPNKLPAPFTHVNLPSLTPCDLDTRLILPILSKSIPNELIIFLVTILNTLHCEDPLNL